MLVASGWIAACGPGGGGADENRIAKARGASGKSPALVRTERRAYDGAPPVMPHARFGMTCIECHNVEGREVEGVGFSPPSPHELTRGLSALSNCSQCHVERVTDETWKATRFVGLPQDLRRGRRHATGAPPVMPHPVFMRENCQACHAGSAAREEIRTSHPERSHCAQCHVEQRTVEELAVDGSL